MQLSPSTLSFLFVYLFAFLLFFFLVLFCCWGLWGLWITGLWCLCWDWLVCCGPCLLMAALSSACSPSLCCCDVVVLTGALTTQLFFSLSLKHTHTTHNPQPTAGHKNGPYYQMDHFICLCFPWGVGAPFDRLLEWCSQTDRLSAPPLSVFNVCVMACAEMVTIPCLYTIRTLLTGNNHEPFFFCLVLNSHICSVFFFLQEGLRGLDSMICSLVCRLFGV